MCSLIDHPHFVGKTRRFWGDLSFVYTTLTDVYGFQENTLLDQVGTEGMSDSHILVLAPSTLSSHDKDLNHSSFHNSENDFLCLAPSDMNYNTELGGYFMYSKSELERLFSTLADLLTPEDKLFIYVTGGGSWDSNRQKSFIEMCPMNGGPSEKIYSDEFSDMFLDIDCAQITLMMQNNYSEGFAGAFMDTEDALCKNRTIFTSTNCLSYPELYFTAFPIGAYDFEVVNEFTYYWASANLGFYPILAYDPESWYQAIQGPWDYPGFGLVGSTDPATSMPWQTYFPNDPYGHEPYDIDPNTDGDWTLSLKEAFTFADNLDTWSPNGYCLPYHVYYDTLTPDSPHASYESGFTAEAAAMTGYQGFVDGTVSTGAEGNRYLLTDDIYITRHSTLTVRDSATFVSNNKTITNQGSLYTENGLRHALFRKTRIEQEGPNMTLDSCVFDSCYRVRAFSGHNSITNSVFSGTDFIGGSSGVRDGLITGLTVTLSDNHFSNGVGTAVKLTRVPEFAVTGNSILSTPKGILLSNCTGLLSDGLVEGNTVTGCTGNGVEIYSSNVRLGKNKINLNGSIGVKLLNFCNVELLGEPLSNTDQMIKNNGKYQIYASKRSFPSQLHYNSIKGVNTADTLIYFDNAGQMQSGTALDVEYNCWSPLNNNAIASVLYAANGQSFDYTPTWCPQVSLDADGSDWPQHMLQVADSLAGAGGYSSAMGALQSLVDQWPDSQEAVPALTAMYSIACKTGKGYDALRDYYRNTKALTDRPDLADCAEWLANRCDVALGRFNEAAAWYEKKIADPATSFADSIFAVIDLGELSLLMDNAGERADMGSMSEYQRETVEEHELKTERLVAMLPYGSSKSEVVYAGQCQGKVSVYPNPFRELATLSYELRESGVVQLVVWDCVGKRVKTVELGRQGRGRHSCEVDLGTLPSGCYHGTLMLNNRSVGNCKLIK